MQRQLPSYESDLMCERSFASAGGGSRQPFRQISIDVNPAFDVQGQRFPGADRRKPQFVGFISELLQNPPPKPFRILQSPEPDVRVQQQFQSRRTSHSLSSLAGETMSPTISKECFIDPIQDERSSTEVGGTTSATGFPKRVTRIGFFVERTRSSTARHLALNSEMLISCIAFLIGHSILWSLLLTTTRTLRASPAGRTNASVPTSV